MDCSLGKTYNPLPPLQKEGQDNQPTLKGRTILKQRKEVLTPSCSIHTKVRGICLHQQIVYYT